MASIMQSLARMIVPRQKINPAGEGNWHPGPYTVSGGVIPAGSPWNYWQCDIDPVSGTSSSSIVEACVWAYVRAIAQLPGYHKRELGNGGYETVTTSALSRLLRSPNPYQTPSDFLVHLIRSLLLNGNSYWIAQRNDRAEVTALHWTDPRACRVREIMVQGQPFSEIFYEISTNPLYQFDSILGRTSLVVPARDVLHIKLATPQHPLIGVTWLTALAMETTSSNAIQNAAATFANNMSRPSGILTSDQQLSKTQVDELRAKWNEQVSGVNSGGVAILNQNMKFQPLTISNVDAQIIDQRKLNDQAVAAVFGVPMILLGVNDTATQKTSEAVMAEWLAAGLGWLINHIEQAFDSFIGLDQVAAGREWTEYDTRVLLRSAFRERIEGLARGVQGGIYSPNEARALEGYAAAEEGDEPRVQMQVIPLSAWDKQPAQPATPAPPPAQPAKTDTQPQSDLAQQKEFVRFLLKREMDFMQLDPQSIIAVVGEVLAEERNARMALQGKLEELSRLPGPQGERGMTGERGENGKPGEPGPAGPPQDLAAVPDDIAEQVAKAISILKESSAPASPAIVLNVSSAAGRKSKRIMTSRDKDGNLVADVIEQD